MLGFEQCGEMTHTLTMRFYRGSETTHHDLALCQVEDPASLPPVPDWSMAPLAIGVNHIAIGYPDRESWLERIHHLKENGVEFKVRGNHGMTHSAYIADPDGYGLEVLYNVPSEAWKDDVDAALNYFEYLPVDGDDVFEDRTDYQRFGPGAPAPAGIPDKLVVRID